MAKTTDHLAKINTDGFSVIRGAIKSLTCQDLIDRFNSMADQESLKTSRGTVFAARNLIDEFEPARTIWREPVLVDLLREVLGHSFGLVRVLYFDKPADRSWVLPWHKDMTVAVNDNQSPSEGFSKPTRKAGVPHFEAPTELLNQMLTLRLHLDEATSRNGALRVIPGSHLTGKLPATSTEQFVTVDAGVGDVLAMRPLISHSSGHTEPESGLHRRILHFEFSGVPKPAADLQWHRFLPCD